MVRAIVPDPEAAAGGSGETPPAPRPVKIVVAGGAGVGRSTFVETISEIGPGTDGAAPTAGPARTTGVDLDFGRMTLAPSLWLYLFGPPGRDRFWFMWDGLVRGAVGAVVLVDTRRLPDCFPAVDYFESRGLPFLVAVNRFNNVTRHRAEAVREALGVGDHVPIVFCDARHRGSVRETVVRLVEHVVARSSRDASGEAPLRSGPPAVDRE